MHFDPTPIADHVSRALATVAARMLGRPTPMESGAAKHTTELRQLAAAGKSLYGAALPLPPAVRKSVGDLAPSGEANGRRALEALKAQAAGSHPRGGWTLHASVENVCREIAACRGVDANRLFRKIRTWPEQQCAADPAFGRPDAYIGRIIDELASHNGVVVGEEHVWWLSLLELLNLPDPRAPWSQTAGPLLPSVADVQQQMESIWNSDMRITMGVRQLVDRMCVTALAQLWGVGPTPAILPDHLLQQGAWRALPGAQALPYSGRTLDEELTLLYQQVYVDTVPTANTTVPADVSRCAARLLFMEPYPPVLTVSQLVQLSTVVVEWPRWQQRADDVWYRSIRTPLAEKKIEFVRYLDVVKEMVAVWRQNLPYEGYQWTQWCAAVWHAVALVQAPGTQADEFCQAVRALAYVPDGLSLVQFSALLVLMQQGAEIFAKTQSVANRYNRWYRFEEAMGYERDALRRRGPADAKWSEWVARRAQRITTALADGNAEKVYRDARFALGW